MTQWTAANAIITLHTKCDDVASSRSMSSESDSGSGGSNMFGCIKPIKLLEVEQLLHFSTRNCKKIAFIMTEFDFIIKSELRDIELQLHDAKI